MKFILFSLMLASSLLHAQLESCTPTEQILPLIAGSTTLWQGSSVWKDRLQRSEIENTSFVQSDWGMIKGGWVKDSPQIDDGIKAYFTITYDQPTESVTIETDMQTLEHRLATEKEQSALQTPSRHPVMTQQLWQQDDFTLCTGTSTITYYDTEKTLVKRGSLSCTTRLPFDLFMAAVNTAADARN